MFIEKYIRTPLKSRFLSLFVTQKQWEEWMPAWRFFFILANGRSGTNFLANLLNQAQGAYVFHEPVLEDFYAYFKAFYDPGQAEKYMRGFRKKEIYLRMRNMRGGIYGEVNGVLRCHADAIKNVFPGSTLIHLVRDGRDVIRSTMSRSTMTIKSPFSMGVSPADGNVWKTRWREMDRFSRICWLWQEENVRLRKSVWRLAQFEKIISNYDYFYEEVLAPCNLSMSRKIWEAAVKSPRNVTNKFEMPKWDDWSPEQKKTFLDICGEEMSMCGYNL